MALDVAEFLWNKFLKALAELDSESNSGFVTIPLFKSAIKDLVSKFKEIKDFVNERDIMPEPYTYSETIDLFYDLNDALAECRVITHECKEIKNKLLSLNPRRAYSLTTIKNKLTKIEDELQKLKALPKETGSPLGMTRPMLSSEVFGFRDESKKIEDLLLREEGSSSSSAGRLRAIGVFGTAGVGKTTLVQMVVESLKVQNKFKLILWLPFSGMREGEQQNSRFSFETCIYDELGKILDKSIVGLDKLLERLSQLLSDNRYLIVLDDVCHQHINIMERLVSGLPKASGGALIVTSRLREVAQKLGEQKHLIHVQPQEGVCLKILDEKQCLISQGKSNKTLEKVTKEMKDQCHGLPLVAKTLADFIPEIL
ncbi:putative disease resistance protein RGA3 [Rosa sericea]